MADMNRAWQLESTLISLAGAVRTGRNAEPAALAAPLLLTLDDTEFVAGGLCAASSVQAAMRFWLHGHDGLPAHMTRCTYSCISYCPGLLVMDATGSCSMHLAVLGGVCTCCWLVTVG